HFHLCGRKTGRGAAPCGRTGVTPPGHGLASPSHRVWRRRTVMHVDHIRYDILAREALRGVVRTVLDDTAKHGLPGEHHFYITFDPRAQGVRLPPRLTAQFPEEMTIVLQHQFWDLVVKDDSFEVGISFGGIPERLAVPFAAIKGFLDPSVQFVLKFEELAEPV